MVDDARARIEEWNYELEVVEDEEEAVALECHEDY